MKILVVDNKTIHLQYILQALKGHEVEIRRYKPGINLSDHGKDLIILSGGGGEGEELNDTYSAGHLWYETEIEFVKNCTKPIIGICMGFEVIAKAFGRDMDKVECYFEDFKSVKTTRKGKKFLDMTDMKQFEAHHMGIKKAPKGFDVLAESEYGVEIIKHRRRPILATQFHPEFPGGTLNLKTLVNQFA
jgi:GMP synthase-like glutamine amidotransferase